MCGIFGFVAPKGSAPDLYLEAATESLLLRGPDSSGYSVRDRVAFGARRLAIIDLQSGDQPVETACGRVVAMQNGEIYNFGELRAELLRMGLPLKTSGDTEVLAYGYLAWGLEGLLRRIDGMYAFAIHDRASQCVHIARDRMGEKPLFYYADARRLVFSSQLLTVLRHPDVPFGLNPTGIEAYLALHYVPGEETVLQGIKKLPPAHFLTWSLESDEYSVRRYWGLLPRSDLGMLDRRELPAAVRARVSAAVASRLVSDVPVGAFLSGGIDSSVIVACMADRVADLKTFSVGFDQDDLDESPYARLVAERFGTDHHHLMFGLKDFDALVPEVVEAMDEPIGDQAMLPVLLMARLARRHVTVVVSGEGADEVFGGYEYYRAMALPHDWRYQAYRAIRPFHSPSVDELLLLGSRGTTPSGYPLVFDGPLLNNILRRGRSFESGPWAGGFRHDLSAFHDALQGACFTDLVTWLPDNLLVKLDKMAMAVSLEGRCPYLKPDLVEWALALPQQFKLGSRLSKQILREAFADALPSSIVNRPKQGFVLPLAQFFRESGRSMILDHLAVGMDDDILFGSRLGTYVEKWLSMPEPPVRQLMALLLYRMWLTHAYRQPKFRRSAGALGDIAASNARNAATV